MQYISPTRDTSPSPSPSPSSSSSSGAQRHIWQQNGQNHTNNNHQLYLQDHHIKADCLPASAPAPAPASYPSPPMSGSPAPPATSQEASERMVPITTSTTSSYSLDPSSAAVAAAAAAANLYPISSGSRTEDLYRSTAPMMHTHTSHQPDDLRAHHQLPVMPLHHQQPPPMAAYQPMAQHPATTQDFDRMGFYHRPDAYPHFMPHATAIIPSNPYPPQPQQIVQSMGPSMGQATMYGNPARPATVPGSTDMGAYGSPKPSRKAKGHVASACVPCKKAHLRCDTHRPCTRCLMNGKEESCVDVQHKKRGRPRLRDDRETRYDPRFPSASSSNETSNMRRPLGPSSSYSSAASTSASAANTVASGESLPPRFIEHASASDANIYSSTPPVPMATNTMASSNPSTNVSSNANSNHGPIAYLMLKDLEIAKASTAFSEAVGISLTYGMKLHDIVAPCEREKIKTLNNEMRGEQERSQPNYLPPIFADHQVDRVIQSLKFTAEDISRFNMDRRDRWDFQSSDGQIRTHEVRFGLAKQDSRYFVVLQIVLPNRFQFSASASGSMSGSVTGSVPSPHVATGAYGAYPVQHAQMPQLGGYGHSVNVSSAFDANRGGSYGDGSLSTRQAQQQAHSNQLLPGPSPGISPGLSAYAASPSRPDYAMGPASFHTPRTEMPNTPRQQQPLLPPQTQAQSLQMQTQNQSQTQISQTQQHQTSQASSGCHQLPPIRGQTPNQTTMAATQSMSMMGNVDSGWIKDERTGRVNIEGLLERPSHLQRQPPSA